MRPIFPALRAIYRKLPGILIGSSRRLLMLRLVGIITWVKIFRLSVKYHSSSSFLNPWSPISEEKCATLDANLKGGCSPRLQVPSRNLLKLSQHRLILDQDQTLSDNIYRLYWKKSNKKPWIIQTGRPQAGRFWWSGRWGRGWKSTRKPGEILHWLL